MAIPEKPYTRKEMYLNAIAGGNGGIPSTPYTREEMYLDAIASGSGGGGSALPSVTSADNGKVLSVVDGAWAADEKRFVVTLSALADDMSGTMDKTPAEIDGAWNSGKSIWFSFPFVGIMMPMSERRVLDDVEGGGVEYFAHVILDGVLLNVITSTSGNTYTVENYQLTPMGS